MDSTRGSSTCVDTCIDGNTRIQDAAQNAEIVMLVNIDRCALLGPDTYDIISVMQFICPAVRMHTNSDGVQVLQHVARDDTLLDYMYETMRLLVNPSLKATFDLWTAYLRAPPPVVLYTNKRNIIQYAREMNTPMVIPDLLVLRGGTRSRHSAEYVTKQIAPTEIRQHAAFERLGMAGHAVSKALGLQYTPIIIATNRDKNMADASVCLGNYPVNHMFLYDDCPSGSRLRDPNTTHVVPVPQFTYSHFSAPRLAIIREITSHFHIPQDGSQVNLEIYATPPPDDWRWPTSHCAIVKDKRSPGTYVWQVGVARCASEPHLDRPWIIPDAISFLGIVRAARNS